MNYFAQRLLLISNNQTYLRDLVTWVLRVLNSEKVTEGSAMSQPTQPKDTGQVVQNRGGLGDRYRIKS
jgi:hypothetical protein